MGSGVTCIIITPLLIRWGSQGGLVRQDDGKLDMDI